MTVRIESLAFYPIKGCHRVECEGAELLSTGLRHDREWMIVELDGKFITQRTDAVLWGDYKLNVPDAYRTTTVETRSPLQQNIASTIAAALSVTGRDRSDDYHRMNHGNQNHSTGVNI